jgi:hypothetical protein
MKTLYLDLLSGISGDMFLGALLDLGVDFHQLEQELKKLPVGGYQLRASRQQRSHIAGTKFDVLTHVEDAHAHAQPADHDHPHEHGHGHEHVHEHEHGRSFVEIDKLIMGSSLSDWVKRQAVAIFWRVAVAEGRIHARPADQVHFHEVGAVDSIIDIVGACIALELLDRPRLLASTVVEGTGWVHCAHGRFPVPAPATLEILTARGVMISQCDEPHELVTPTGAALLAELVESFGPIRNLAVSRVGYGLGARENKTRPNVLRVLLCDEAAPQRDWEADTVAMLQTNLDDINAELLGRFLETALAQGALDVFHTPIQMKKNRPGILLSVLCAEADADKFSELILRETTAFGVRRHLAERRKLQRESKQVTTPFGPVTVKVGRLNGELIQCAPEFESCRALADQAKVSLKTIYEAAQRAALQP